MNGIEVSGERIGARSFLRVCAVRRVDVFAGDRPYQRIAAEGQDLGLLIDMGQLAPSPIQDDVIEIATDRPYGAVVEERDHDRSDGLRLRVVEYELMAQLALDDAASNSMLSSATVSLEASSLIEEAFCAGEDPDEVQFLMASEGV